MKRNVFSMLQRFSTHFKVFIFGHVHLCIPIMFIHSLLSNAVVSPSCCHKTLELSWLRGSRENVREQIAEAAGHLIGEEEKLELAAQQPEISLWSGGFRDGKFAAAHCCQKIREK